MLCRALCLQALCTKNAKMPDWGALSGPLEFFADARTATLTLEQGDASDDQEANVGDGSEDNEGGNWNTVLGQDETAQV